MSDDVSAGLSDQWSFAVLTGGFAVLGTASSFVTHIPSRVWIPGWFVLIGWSLAEAVSLMWA